MNSSIYQPKRLTGDVLAAASIANTKMKTDEILERVLELGATTSRTSLQRALAAKCPEFFKRCGVGVYSISDKNLELLAGKVNSDKRLRYEYVLSLAPKNEMFTKRTLSDILKAKGVEFEPYFLRHSIQSLAKKGLLVLCKRTSKGYHYRVAKEANIKSNNVAADKLGLSELDKLLFCN